MKRILLFVVLALTTLTIKAQAVSSLRLDRNITIGFDENSIKGKAESTFDANGKLNLQINYSWDTTTQSFVPNYKEEFTYDANGNRTLYIFYFWNTNTQSFVPNIKYEWTYDANGNCTLSISYYWDTTSQSFVPYNKGEWTYDANGNDTLIIAYDWNTDTQTLIPSDKYEYTFDANGNQTLLIAYQWNTRTKSFVPSFKREYTYDVNGYQTLYKTYDWNNTTKSFVQNYKEEFTYDANGNRTLSIYYSWNTDTQTFVPNYKVEGTYDANGNRTLEIRYDWNTDTQTFVTSFKDVRTYNNGLPITFLTQKTIYKWYSGLGVYKPSFKTEYSTILDTDSQLHRKGVLYQYDTNFNVWNEIVGDEYNCYEYYTKTASLSTQTIKKNLTLLYPNPVLNVLNIKVDYNLINQPYNVFDSLGRVILNGKLNDVDNSINVEQLSKGVYYLKVSDNKASKFIKE